jgi:hypothetical protein
MLPVIILYLDRNKKQITLLWEPGHMGIPGNKQADEEAKAALDDDIQQNEEYPSKDIENDKDQKRAIEKRKQQQERKKDRTRISRRHKRHDEQGN